MTKSRVKDALILFLITIIAGVALGAVYYVTKAPIAQAEYNKIQSAYREVMPDAKKFVDLPTFKADDTEAILKKAGLSDHNTIDACVQGVDDSGKLVGYVITVTDDNSYGGDIVLSMGILKDGTVTGYSLTTINDTAGLGMKAKDEAFSSQFKNKKVDFFEVTKSGASSKDEIDAISGATITSKAVTYAVDAGIAYGKYLLSKTGGEVVK
jgi:electron transport complex protein RnfG